MNADTWGDEEAAIMSGTPPMNPLTWTWTMTLTFALGYGLTWWLLSHAPMLPYLVNLSWLR